MSSTSVLRIKTEQNGTAVPFSPPDPYPTIGSCERHVTSNQDFAATAGTGAFTPTRSTCANGKRCSKRNATAAGAARQALPTSTLTAFNACAGIRTRTANTNARLSYSTLTTEFPKHTISTTDTPTEPRGAHHGPERQYKGMRCGRCGPFTDGGAMRGGLACTPLPVTDDPCYHISSTDQERNETSGRQEETSGERGRNGDREAPRR